MRTFEHFSVAQDLHSDYLRLQEQSTQVPFGSQFVTYDLLQSKQFIDELERRFNRSDSSFHIKLAIYFGASYGTTGVSELVPMLAPTVVLLQPFTDVDGHRHEAGVISTLRFPSVLRAKIGNLQSNDEIPVGDFGNDHPFIG